jgi:alkylated DNA repair dioxygenase AlkB
VGWASSSAVHSRRLDDLTTLSTRSTVIATSQTSQFSLFETDSASVAGLQYQPDLLSPAEEARLVEHFAHLPFKAFDFHGYFGKRRIVSFGWHYNFSKQSLAPAEDIPAFLLPIRERAAEFAELAPADLQHAMVTEYAPGAGIGWHRDKAVFSDVIGISLVSPCTIRLRRKIGSTWQRKSFSAESRSAYLLRGSVRTEWEHSIAPLASLRYSITFRKLR